MDHKSNWADAMFLEKPMAEKIFRILRRKHKVVESSEIVGRPELQ